MFKATRLFICTLLVISLLVVVVLAETSSPQTHKSTSPSETNTATHDPTVKVKLSKDRVEPSEEEHDMFVTDGEHHDKETAEEQKIEKDHQSKDQQHQPLEKQQKQQNIKEQTQQNVQEHEQRLFRRDPFRFVNGIWDEMNNEFKSMSTYMNDLFEDVLDKDFFKSKREKQRTIQNDEDDKDDSENLFGRTRWATFNKIFNEFKFDDDFTLDSPFFNKLLGNTQKDTNKQRSTLKEPQTESQEKGNIIRNKILKPLKNILQRGNSGQQEQKRSKQVSNRSLFLGGITEGTRGYQVQLEIPEHLTKNDVKVSVRKVHDNLSIVNIKGEKKYEQNVDGRGKIEKVASHESHKPDEQRSDIEPKSTEKGSTTKVYQSFERVFTIGRPILKENIEAKLENGILNVFIPKDPNVKDEQSDYEVNIM